MTPCTYCAGSGKDPDYALGEHGKCPCCDGTGESWTAVYRAGECPRCRGTGDDPWDDCCPCADCGGTGRDVVRVDP